MIELLTLSFELLDFCRIVDGIPKELGRESLLTELAHAADWYKRDVKAGEIPVAEPPRRVADALLAESPTDMPELVGTTRLPIIRPDGSLHTSRGYDNESRMFLTVDWSGIELIDDPPGKIAERLLAPFCDFEFADDASRSAYLAALITPYARSAYDGATPFILLSANTPGSGKSRLAKYVGRLAIGKDVYAGTFPVKEEERQKTILSKALHSVEFAIFDNAKCEIGGPALESVVTEGTVSGRLLHTNDIGAMEVRTIWMASANNATVSNDMRRRTLPVHLESTYDRPEERTDFAIADIDAHIDRIRERWIADAVSLLSQYLKAGCPCDVSPWGSFERWSKVVRGAIVWAGLTDPIQAKANLDAFDESREALIALFNAWPFEHGQTVTSREIANRDDAALNDALEGIDAEPGRSRSVGRAIGKHVNRWIDGRRIERRLIQGTTHWVLKSRSSDDT